MLVFSFLSKETEDRWASDLHKYLDRLQSNDCSCLDMGLLENRRCQFTVVGNPCSVLISLGDERGEIFLQLSPV